MTDLQSKSAIMTESRSDSVIGMDEYEKQYPEDFFAEYNQSFLWVVISNHRPNKFLSIKKSIKIIQLFCI